MKNSILTDIVIIGAGPIGLFTVFQAGMLGMHSHVIDSLDSIGGQCTALYSEKPIYDIPAYPCVLAHDLINKLNEQNQPFNPTYHLNQQVISLNKFGNDFEIITSNNLRFIAKIVVIASGSGFFGPNKPPLNNIEQYEGKSVFYSITDKQQFTDKKIVIAGGGDSAVDWALSLSSLAKKIYLVHRRDKFRAAPASLDRLKNEIKNNNIELMVPYQLYNLQGNNGILNGVMIQNFEGNTTLLEADILLPFFGLAANLGPILNWGLNIDMHHIQVSLPYYETNIKGIYAVGDIAGYEGKLKLILSGFAEAASAMHHAYIKVFEGQPLHFKYSTNKGVVNF